MRSGNHNWVIFRRRHGIVPVLVLASVALGQLAPGAAAAPRKPPPTAQPLWQLYPLAPAAGRPQPQPPPQQPQPQPRTSTAPAPAATPPATPPATTSVATVPRPKPVSGQPTASHKRSAGIGRVRLMAVLAAVGLVALVPLVRRVRRSARARRRLTERD